MVKQSAEFCMLNFRVVNGSKVPVTKNKKAPHIFAPSALGRGGWCCAKYIEKLIFHKNSSGLMKNRVTTLPTFNVAIRVATERFRTCATALLCIRCLNFVRFHDFENNKFSKMKKLTASFSSKSEKSPDLLYNFFEILWAGLRPSTKSQIVTQ